MRALFFLVLASLFAGGCSKPIATTPSARASDIGVAATTPESAARTVSFKFATQTLTVPEGFTVELVAAPPLVNRPISVAFDDSGRLYATDSSGLSDRAPVQYEQKPHRVVRLEDADGDGRFDRSTVFAEKMMFPQGALFYEGSLYVGAPPELWKLTDKDGDGISDERSVWYDGKTLTGCANDMHGPYLGLEGRIYWTKGAYAEQVHTLANGKKVTTTASHIFRAKPDGTEREIMLTGGMANPVGVTFTATGERILSGTFFQTGTPGKRDGLIHAVYGGVYGQDRADVANHVRTGDLMPIMTHMGAAAPCGSTTYRSTIFGSDYANNLFVCYFNLRKISRHRLVPDGAALRTVDTDFVTSDSHDFHPTDVLEDADGSLLVIDTGGWYKICCPTSQLAKPDVLGGIYRIRKTGAPVPADPRGTKIPWAAQSPADLARLLGDSRTYVADRAIHLLGKQGEPAVKAIQASALESASAATRRNALWALARINGQSARAAVRTGLSDTDSSVLQTALQVVGLWRDRAAFDRLTELLNDTNATAARLAAEALGRCGESRAVTPLLTATQRLKGKTFTSAGAPTEPAERLLEHALIYALVEIGARDAVYAQLKSSSNVRWQRVALVALDQMSANALSAEDVIGWLDSTERVLKQTAGWVVGNHADWGDALTAFFEKRLGGKSLTAGERTDLQTQLAGLANSAAIQNLLSATAASTAQNKETRLLALSSMAAARLKESPPRWLEDLAAILTTPGNDAAIARQAVATTRGLSLPKGGNPKLAQALAQTGRDPVLPADVRLEALAAATPAAMAQLEPALFEFLCSHLDQGQPMPVRGAAAKALAQAPLTPEQQFILANKLTSLGPLEVPKLIPAFERKPTESLGLKVIASLRQSSGLSGLRANALKPVFAKYPPKVQREGEALMNLINADAARQNARVDELLASISGGDIRRGQSVFHSAKAACSLCHMVGYLGGRLGPDLTGIGKIRNERELLEAVVFPNATFVRGYEPFTVTTKTGGEHSGILKQDTPAEVILATGPDSEQRIPREHIRDLQPAAFSPMPPGMDVILTKQEISDLVAFLKSRQ